MFQLKSYYLAGDVAAVIGIQPITLRVWRERGYCDLGYTELVDGLENERARRRYTPVNICQIAIAQELINCGFSPRRAFEWVANTPRSEAIIKACAAGVVHLEIPDLIIGIAGGGPTHKRWTTTTMRYANGSGPADEVPKGLQPIEFTIDINVSAIVARVLATLSASFGKAEIVDGE